MDKKQYFVLLPIFLVLSFFTSLPIQAQSKLTYIADGSVPIQSFSVRTITPNTTVSVKFPDGIVAEAVSDNEYRLTQFAHRIKDVPAPWTIEISVEGIASFASQQTGITKVDLTGCKEIKRLTLPYQNLESINLSGLEEMEELYLHGNTKLKALDVTDLTELKILNISNTEGLIPVGLNHCTALSYLYAYNSSLSNPDLSALTELQVLDLTNTKTSSIDLSKNTKLQSVELTDNLLTDVNGNILQHIDLHQNAKLVELNVSSNQLQTLNIVLDSLTSLDCGANRLPISQLPMRGNLSTYIYWPQKDFMVAQQVEVGKPLDLSQEAEATGVAQSKKKTVFFVYDSEGNMLSEGDDYTCTNGIFTFSKAFDKALRIKIKTAAFPKLKDKASLYSTYFKVVTPTTGINSTTTAKDPYFSTTPGHLTIVLTDKSASVSIYQLDGKCVTKTSIEPNSPLSLPLPQGVYLIVIGNKSFKVIIP